MLHRNNISLYLTMDHLLVHDLDTTQYQKSSYKLLDYKIPLQLDQILRWSPHLWLMIF